MPEIQIVTSVTIADGRLTFHRARVMIPDGDEAGSARYGGKGEPLTFALDPAEQPAFSPHPDGGWISPPYQQIQEFKDLGIEIEEQNLVKCKCHRDWKHADPADVASLEKHGHARSCPKCPRPTPPPAAYAAPPAAAGNAWTPSSLPESTRAMLGPEVLSGLAPKVDPAPPGGLNDVQLDGLRAALEGTNMGIAAALKEANVPTEGLVPEVVVRQLHRVQGIRKCERCRMWQPENHICDS